MKKCTEYLRKLAFVVVAATVVWHSGFGAAAGERNIPARQFGYKDEVIRLAVMLRSEAAKPSIQGLAEFLTRGKFGEELGIPGITVSETTPHITLAYANILITDSLRSIQYPGKNNDEIRAALQRAVFEAINDSVGKTPFEIKLEFEEVAVQGQLMSPDKWLVARYSLPRDAGQRRLLEKMFNEAKRIINEKCGGNVWFDFDYLAPHVSLAKLANNAIDYFLDINITVRPENKIPFTITKGRGWLGVEAYLGVDVTKIPLPCQRAMGVRLPDIPDIRPEAAPAAIPAPRPVVQPAVRRPDVEKQRKIDDLKQQIQTLYSIMPDVSEEEKAQLNKQVMDLEREIRKLEGW